MWGGSLVPIGSFVGRLAVGSVTDRFDKRHVAIAMFGLQGLGILAFSLSESPLALFASTLLFGITIGNIFMLQSLLTAEIGDVAAGVLGAVVRDPLHDGVAWREYLEAVVADRDGWGDFYDACRALD